MGLVYEMLLELMQVCFTVSFSAILDGQRKSSITIFSLHLLLLDYFAEHGGLTQVAQNKVHDSMFLANVNFA